MPGYLLIDEPGRLAELLGGLHAAGRRPLDTEFVRERTYYARLCLLQVAGPEGILLVDPLRIADDALLRRLLLPGSGQWIVHAARQDIEVLMPLTGEPLAPVFDTQVAAALLGFPAQVGYAGLVGELLGVELEKGHARTDWAARPLKLAQLTYAADDVRYLGPVADELESRLDAAGRLDWLAEDCAMLADPGLYRTEPADAWRRLKGLERMRPEERQALRALAAWREERAMRRNLPRGWVLSDDGLRELARRRPRSAADLRQVEALPASFADKFAGEILEQLDRARGLPDPIEDLSTVERLTPAQQDALRRLQEVVQEIAAAAGINGEVLATRRDLTAIVRGARDAPPLRGWRRAVVGDRLLAAA